MAAEDAAGNLSAASNEASASVSQAAATGLVAAYSFDEGSGTTVTDRSGNNNTGTLSNTSWSTSGKYGKALSFNGTNAWVTVPSSNSLSLTSGMTLEGWVRPDVENGFQALVLKERPGDLVYGLYSSPTRASRSRR